MINTQLSVSIENNYLEPFDERIDTLFRELELATKWQRPSVLWAIYSSEYVRADADTALEVRLNNLGQIAYHIKIRNQNSADISLQIAKLASLDNVVFFIEGLRWGAGQDDHYAYHALKNHREFFIDNQIRVVFWLTEKEAIDLAHHAPDYWELRHRVIEFVDPPKPNQLSPYILESVWRGTGEFTNSIEDLDAKIALRSALLTDLPTGDESTATRANLLLTLGMLHWRRGEFERSTQFLNTALDLSARLDDNYFEALCFNAIALVQTDLGRIEEAIKAYQNSISLAPDQIFPWNNLGHLYSKLGRYADAISAYLKAIEQNGSDAASWNGLGDVYLETRHFDEAVHAYLKAIEISPDHSHSWCGLGNTHLEEGRLDDALVAHKKAIEIDRRTVDSWLGLGAIFRTQGNDENACMAYQTALELDPQNASAWIELGNLRYKAGAYDEAMRSYMKGIEFNQGSSQTYSNLASIFIHKDLHSEAIPMLLKGIELSEDKILTANLWNRLGDSYRQVEDYDNAVAAYRNADAHSLETDSPQVEGSMLISEPPCASSEGIDEKLVAHPDLKPAREDNSLPESSEAVSVDLTIETFVVDDQARTNPQADFVDWLDGLASVMPVNSPKDFTESDISIQALDMLRDVLHESAIDGENQIRGEGEPILSAEIGTFHSSELSVEALDGQIYSDIPFGVVTSETSQDGLDSTGNMEKEEMPRGTSDLESETYQETTVSLEDSLQGNLIEKEDANQMQLTINEKNAQIWNELGNIYYNTGAFEEALHAFEMAIELDPSYGWSYNNLASIHYHNKRYEEAIPLYEKGIQLLDDQKDQAVLWNRLGDAFRRLSQHDQAVTAYQKAMELDPENVSLLSRARFSLLANLGLD